MDIELNDIVLLIKAVSVAINKKVYTKEELDVFFDAWNDISSKIEKIQRKQLVDTLYKDSEEKDSKDVEI